MNAYEQAKKIGSLVNAFGIDLSVIFDGQAITVGLVGSKAVKPCDINIAQEIGEAIKKIVGGDLVFLVGSGTAVKEEVTYSTDVSFGDNMFYLTIKNDLTGLEIDSEGGSLWGAISNNDWSGLLPSWFGETVVVGRREAYIFRKDGGTDFAMDDWGNIYKISDDGIVVV